MSTKKLAKYLFLPFILAVIIFIYWDLPKTFYQQDEWQSLGHNLVQGIDPFFRTNPLLLAFGELRPLSTVMYIVLLGFFKFTVVPTAIFAIFLHAVNSILVYYLINKITKQRVIAIAAALFLATNSVSHQAVTWVSAVGTLPAATFILLAIISYLRYLDTSNRKYVLISLIFTIVSLYFKGMGIFLFIFLLLLNMIYKNNSFSIKNTKNIISQNLPFFIFGFIILFVRLGQVLFQTQHVAGFTNGAGNSSYFQTIFFHIVLYPLTSLFQIFVPPLDLYFITPVITKMQYKFLIGSSVVDLIAQSIVADMIAILGSVVMLGVLGFFVYKLKDKITTRNIIFALLFFFLSFLPYVVLDRDSSYLSSRYFYVGALAAGIIFGYFVYFLANLNRYSKWIVFTAVFLFLFHHANVVRGDIDHQVKLGNERKAVLNGIKTLKPSLDDQTVFYVTSDKEYYGPITNPFQNGLGYVLEVWYYDGENIPKEFLSENFLWDLGSEGYRTSGGKGFGYFQDIDKLAAGIKKGEFKAENVHAFFIRSSDTLVLDRTSDIRARISTLSATIK